MQLIPESSLNDCLSERVSEILHYIWDPIGVSGAPQARDEYDSYVPQIVGLLTSGKQEEEIEKYLFWIKNELMGLSVGTIPSKNDEEIAKMLLNHYEYLQYSR